SGGGRRRGGLRVARPARGEHEGERECDSEDSYETHTSPIPNVLGTDARALQVRQVETQIRVLDAAVDLEDLPGDERRSGRRQVQGGDGDVVHLAEALQRRT